MELGPDKSRADAIETVAASAPFLLDAVPTAPPQSPSSPGSWRRGPARSPLQFFPVALGASTFGWSTDDRGAAEIIDRFVELGGNFVDATGPHVDGRSERAIGGWLTRSGSRSRILLGTTIGHQHDLSERPAAIVAHAVEAALSRLRTDHLDLLSVHLSENSPIDEVLIAVDEVVRSGKVRFVAASAPTANRLIEARIVAAQQGVSPLVAVQANYSLVHRIPFEAEVARVVALQDCGFMPRQPLAGGLLVAQLRSKQEAGRRQRHGVAVTLPAKRWPGLMAALAATASALGASVPAVALAWLLSRPNVTAPIVSVSSVPQLAEAMSAVRVQLTRHQAAELDRLSR